MQDRLKEVFGFRPTQKQKDHIENYMAIKHIVDRSEALRTIVDEWISNRRELESLRDFINRLPQQTGKSLLTLKECPMLDRAFNTYAEQQFACSKCEKRTPETFSQCQQKEGHTIE